MKAMIVNRVGDVGLALAMFTLFASISTLDFATVFSLIPYIREESTELLGLEINTVSLIGALILVGAVGKSAQMGLHT
jgi:NADH-quinone oxidoreductase subunit L